eukprot:scaffold57454_cov32-Phaeocystis_antarctica.AAC.1
MAAKAARAARAATAGPRAAPAASAASNTVPSLSHSQQRPRPGCPPTRNESTVYWRRTGSLFPELIRKEGA